MLRRLLINDVLDLDDVPLAIEVLELRTSSLHLDWTPSLSCTNLRELSVYSTNDRQPAALAPRNLSSLQRLQLKLSNRDESCPVAVRDAVVPAIGALTHVGSGRTCRVSTWAHQAQQHWHQCYRLSHACSN